MTGSIAWVERMAFLAAHPVGSFFWTNRPENPGGQYGGKWEQIKDVFLLAAGSIHTAGSVGGEENHTLLVNEMPEHSHEINGAGNIYFSEGSKDAWINRPTVETGYETETKRTGRSQPHNNMPPYLAAYCWRRVA